MKSNKKVCCNCGKQLISPKERSNNRCRICIKLGNRKKIIEKIDEWEV